MNDAIPVAVFGADGVVFGDDVDDVFSVARPVVSHADVLTLEAGFEVENALVVVGLAVGAADMLQLSGALELLTLL